MQHPEITWAERTGYPSWMQETEDFEPDEDAAYDMYMERMMEDGDKWPD